MPDTLPSILNAMDQDRLRRYRQNLDFYNGRQWPQSIGTQGSHRQLTFNYAKAFVDKLASYVMSGITPMVRPIPDESGAEGRDQARRAEDTLAEVYDGNHLAVLDLDTEIDCSILGDAAYKVIWDPAWQRVRITAPDVQGLFAWWRGDDVSQVYRVASRYSLSADQVLDLYGFAPANDTATIIEDWTANTFSLWIDDTLHATHPNPYGFIPFVIYPYTTHCCQ